jgi:hypothetical protein
MGIFAYFVSSFLDVLLAVPLFLSHAQVSKPMEKRYPAHPLAFSMEPTNRLKKEGILLYIIKGVLKRVG